MRQVTNIVLGGLGGQGVLTASDILADAVFRAGFEVKKSELHGMSQRGGSVSSDVRYGPRVLSPMVPQGEADYLVVLDIDLSYSPDHIERMLARIRQTKAKIVIASPYMEGGKVSNVPWLRRVLSIWANRYLCMAVTRDKFSDKISAGLGVFNPFGLGTDWGDTWEGRYLATKSEMATYNINPAVSFQVLPWLSVAAGLDIMILDATLENKINLTGATMGVFGPLPDANQKFDGDGTGVGFNVGMAADLTKDVTLGFAYRSEISVDPEGDVSFAIPGSIPEPLYSGLRSTFTNSGAKTHITLPQQIYAGVAYKGLPRWIFEAGMRWEGWSSFKHLKVNLDNGLTSSRILIGFGSRVIITTTKSIINLKVVACYIGL
ncbi:MAG: glycosyltransferase, partial [Thiobacillus sp.]|nr:glycosyltransferase [Thiobacillus sp.]